MTRALVVAAISAILLSTYAELPGHRDCLVWQQRHQNSADRNGRGMMIRLTKRTADRREYSLSITSTLKLEARLAFVSGRSACSR
jgi:hypothetical protein